MRTYVVLVTVCVNFLGASVSDYGYLGVMPVFGLSSSTVKCVNAAPFLKGDTQRICGFLTPLLKSSEFAQPGYYGVTLDDSARSGGFIDVELSATLQGAMHRYTWRGAEPSANGGGHFVVFDLCHMISFNADQCADAHVEVDYERQTVSGWLHSLGSFSHRFGGMKYYFTASFSEPFAAATSGLWRGTDGATFPSATSLAAPEPGVYLDFGAAPSIEVAIGISFVSVEQARINFDAQLAGRSFNDTLASAQEEWADSFRSVLTVSADAGSTPADRVKFFTALYHSLTSPTVWSEEGGVYLGFDGAIHTMPKGHRFYTDLSLWDVMRSQQPLLVLLLPKIADDIIASMLLMGEQSGLLPKWAMGAGDTDCMIGLHSVPVMVNGYLAGLGRGGPGAGSLVNATAMLEQSVRSLRHFEGDDWVTLGYKPNKPSETVEWALADFCAATLAEQLGEQAIAAEFLRTSNNWRNNWHDGVKFFCAKDASGASAACDDSTTWPLESLQTIPFDEHYTEGDAWHWRFYPLHAFDELFETWAGGPGGDTRPILDALGLFMNKSTSWPSNFMPNPWYWPGNEPDLQSPFGFHYLGRPELSHAAVRGAMDRSFTLLTDGIAGNDDYGAMSAWYVLNALGLYPIPCRNQYAVGSPRFAEVTVHRPGAAGPITLKANNLSPDHTVVKGASVNGVAIPLQRFFIDGDALHFGPAVVEFDMGPVE